MNLNSREASAFYELNGLVECVYGNIAIFTHILYLKFYLTVKM